MTTPITATLFADPAPEQTLERAAAAAVDLGQLLHAFFALLADAP